MFFTEFQGSGVSSDFKANLQRYTEDAIRKFTKTGGQWTTDHELMLNTVLSERFAMASAIKQANEEIEKSKALADLKGKALREKETQFQEMSKSVQDAFSVLSELKQNNQSFSSNNAFNRAYENLNALITTKFAISLAEPVKILGDFEGSGNDWNRLLSFVRERNG